MDLLYVILLIAAGICFLVATFPRPASQIRIGLVPLGLLLLTLYFLLSGTGVDFGTTVGS